MNQAFTTTTHTTKTALDILKEARDLLNKGWTKGMYTDMNGAYCAVGALRQVATGDYGLEHVVPMLFECIPNHPSEFREWWNQWDEIVSFNDRLSTAKEDVLALFDCAIQKAEAGA